MDLIPFNWDQIFVNPFVFGDGLCTAKLFKQCVLPCECIEGFWRVNGIMSLCLCKGFFVSFAHFARGFLTTLGRFWRVRGLHFWILSLFVAVLKKAFCTCSSILKTNKIGPHWSWTRRHSPSGTNSVIIRCPHSYGLHYLFIYILSVICESLISLLFQVFL